MDTTHRWDRAKATPPVLYNWEVTGEDMAGVSGDDGAGTASTTRNCDSQIAPLFHLLLTAEMDGRPTKPNAGGIDDASAAMSPQVLEQLGRQMGRYGRSAHL